MSNKFKAMKFWIGDDPKLSEQVQRILFKSGYVWPHGGAVVKNTGAPALYVNFFGNNLLTYGEFATHFNNCEHEEINIDWMRTPKKETIELNGKKYLKEDLEEALKHIKPMD